MDPTTVVLRRKPRLMRRALEIRVAFSPTRLSEEYLRSAYEVVTPLIERAVVSTSEEQSEVRVGPVSEAAMRRPRAR